MKFTYTSGSRPLDGYTIKRGIGHGGFGEVYYAVSDGGKEVALKLVRSNLEIELRGMAQCLNLKHPNLVALHDIKKDADGQSWVVMEYVVGENLSAVLNRHPRGLPLDLVRSWFVSMAKAVGCLHDHGIVHRDLKPGNIFIENGVVKVGDYGLSKCITSSQRSAQTQSVGTVHYMAPEVSTGNYGKGIDIYAAGVILYEMLTGRVPFDGESAGEILMKHLTATPDLSKLPAGYASIVGTALAKNPAERFASFDDMARAVEHLASGAVPSAANVAAPASAPAVLPMRRAVAEPPLVLPADLGGRTKLAELAASMFLAAVAAALLAMIWRAVDVQQRDAEIGAAFYLAVLSTWSVLIPAKIYEGRRGDPWMRRGIQLLFGLGIGVAAAYINGWSIRTVPAAATSIDGPLSMEMTPLIALFAYMSYFGVAFCLLRWWKLAERTRCRRFSFFPVLVTAVAVYLLAALLWPGAGGRLPEPGGLLQGPLALTVAAVLVQLVSPWSAPAVRPARPLRVRYA